MNDEAARRTRVAWGDHVDAILRGDLAVAAAYVTPLGGAVVTSVAPCGLADRARGTLGFTTSLGLAKKLEHIVRDPHVALAYHTREHGFASGPSFVLVQGVASVDLEPSRARLEALRPDAERFLGPVESGVLWDRLLREYYTERVFVDVAVERLSVWDNLAAAGNEVVIGRPAPSPPAPQRPPANGTAPRVDVDAVAGRLSALPHRLLSYRGTDGFPVVVPVDLGGHDRDGLILVTAAPLPAGGRRAGLLGHAFRPRLVGLATRTMTGWLEVEGGHARYSPHTVKGWMAPPNKTLLLVANGLLAKVGVRRARKHGLDARLAALALPRGEAARTRPPAR